MTDNLSSSLTKGSKEFEGKTVDYAIETAYKHFDVEHGNLEIEILTRGSTGIFGLGGRKAKIRAVLKQTTAPLTEDKSGEDDKPVEPEANHTKPEAPESEEEIFKPGEEVPEEDQDKQISLAKEVTEELLRKTGLEGHVVIRTAAKKQYLDISGNDLSLIIGKEGQNLDALEYIVNRILRHTDESYTGINLEAEGYREKRERSISLLAHRTAKKAQKTGRSMTLQPLGPRDRRIVHLALKNVKGIRTHSVGEGILRKVVISPLRKTTRPRQGPKNNSA